MDMPTRRPLAHAEITASLYFWWLAFLRCSRDYWRCCQQRGQCQDDRLVRVWEDFGNALIVIQPFSDEHIDLRKLCKSPPNLC